MRSVPPRFASEPPALAGPALEAELANAAPTSRLAPIKVPFTGAVSAGRSFFCIGLSLSVAGRRRRPCPSGHKTIEQKFS